MDDDGSGNRVLDLVLNVRWDGILRLEIMFVFIVFGVKCCEFVIVLVIFVE